jgi:ferredoxin
MDDLTINYRGLNIFISELLNDYDVIAPVAKEDRYIFDQIDVPSKAVFKYDTTILPPVKWIYPNNEVLLRYEFQDITKTEAVTDFRKQVLAFLHPCDINAINIMDEILAEEPADVNYLARRRSTIIIGYECLGPCRENSLCFDKGYNRVQKGYDLLFTDMGERFYVHVASDAGMAIVEGCNAFRKAAYNDREDLARIKREELTQFENTVHGDMKSLSHLLKENYNNEIWGKEGKKCLSCGACNIVCPTCYCFDVVDKVDVDMKTGYRYRRWDSCQLHGFCKISSGENFRKTAADRVRHRVFKKEVYLKKRFGRSGCVGCGRCIDSCIADISIIDIYNNIMDMRRV